MNSFLVSLAVGSALLALWVVVRFPRLGPEGLLGVAVHLLAANVAAALVPRAIGPALPSLGPVGATMLLVLPVCVYFFAACAWLMVWAQRAMMPYR